MKRLRFTQEQIIGMLKEHSAGAAAADLGRKHGISGAMFCKWRSEMAGWRSLTPSGCVFMQSSAGNPFSNSFWRF